MQNKSTSPDWRRAPTSPFSDTGDLTQSYHFHITHESASLRSDLWPDLW